jgi:hypothetical protein
MNKQRAIGLEQFAHEVAARFSRADREGNFNNESFGVSRIIPLSDDAAAVFFKKSTGKDGLAFFYHINRGASAGWKYFFPTDSHLFAMSNLAPLKVLVEAGNYDKNFADGG